MSNKTNTIRLSDWTYEELFSRKEHPGVTYDDVVRSLLIENESDE